MLYAKFYADDLVLHDLVAKLGRHNVHVSHDFSSAFSISHVTHIQLRKIINGKKKIEAKDGGSQTGFLETIASMAFRRTWW